MVRATLAVALAAALYAEAQFLLQYKSTDNNAKIYLLVTTGRTHEQLEHLSALLTPATSADECYHRSGSGDRQCHLSIEPAEHALAYLNWSRRCRQNTSGA